MENLDHHFPCFVPLTRQMNVPYSYFLLLFYWNIWVDIEYIYHISALRVWYLVQDHTGFQAMKKYSLLQ